MGNFNDFSDLIRLPLGIMASISGLAAGIVVIRLRFPDLQILETLLNQYLGQLIVGFPIPLLIVTASMAINDYYDYPADLKNERLDRPLVRNAFDRMFALYIAIILFAIGLFLSFLLFFLWEDVELLIFIATAGFILIAFSYSTWLKAYGFLGNISVSLSYPAALVLGGAVVGFGDNNSVLITILTFGGLIFVSALGREVLKGVMDVEGDKEQGIKTIAVLYGPKNAAILSTVFFLLALPLAPIPLIYGFKSGISSIIYLSFIILMMFLQLYSGFTLIKDSTKETGIKGRKITKLAFWSGLFGLFFAAITL